MSPGPTAARPEGLAPRTTPAIRCEWTAVLVPAAQSDDRKQPGLLDQKYDATSMNKRADCRSRGRIAMDRAAKFHEPISTSAGNEILKAGNPPSGTGGNHRGLWRARRRAATRWPATLFRRGRLIENCLPSISALCPDRGRVGVPAERRCADMIRSNHPDRIDVDEAPAGKHKMGLIQ